MGWHYSNDLRERVAAAAKPQGRRQTRALAPHQAWILGRLNDQRQRRVVNGLIQFYTIRQSILALASHATIKMRAHSAVCTAQLDFLPESVKVK